ncbi:MAG TPA: homoserine dehydrogenase, partial [Acidimicrobiia bacterium]|nr:homoserine dehydrogenase [Acidimicrobiia bacterium]
QVRIGLLGCGNVGGALVRLVHEHADVIEARAGVPLAVTRVAVRDTTKDRGLPLPARCFTDDPAAVVGDPDIDVVVEVIGGVEPARSLIVEALMAGKPVVTANKELLAVHGRELFETAEGAGVDLLFEASVGGGIPLMRPLRESLAGDRIRRVIGIVNGTTNYILSNMTDHGASFDDALAEAQSLGFAEADPTADVDGYDAAAKAAIIASIAFGARVVTSDVYREGITAITPDDIAAARDLGYVVKLLAIAEEVDGEVAVRVHPTMVPERHPLASVRDAFNAVFIEGDAVGELMFYGRGAGGAPTASAVLGDLVDAAKNLVEGRKGATIGTLAAKPILAIGDVSSQFYVHMEVADRPGVLAAVALKCEEHGVSILSMQQKGIGDDARLVFVTHPAREVDVRDWVHALGDVDSVHRVGSVLRVIGDEE